MESFSPLERVILVMEGKHELVIWSLQARAFHEHYDVEEPFNTSYCRIYRMVLDREAKVVVYSFSYDTLLLDLFIDWCPDWIHTWKTTSNVVIFNEKNIHVDLLTIIKGVGIDYLLAEHSQDEEVLEQVRELIRKANPLLEFPPEPAAR